MDTLRILVISEKQQEALCSSLEEKKFEVLQGTGKVEEAENYVDSPPKVVLIDTEIFDKSGMDFCLELNKHDTLKGTPIIVLGGTEEKQSTSGYKLLGVHGHFENPEDIDGLIEYIREVNSHRMRQSKKIQAYKGRKISLTGELKSMPITEVLQSLEQSSKSGCLYVRETGRIPGKLYFENGKLISGELGPYEGTTAFNLVLTRSEGHFRFEEDVPLPKQNIFGDTFGLMLNAHQKLDEFLWLKKYLTPADDELFFKMAMMEGVLNKEVMEQALELLPEYPDMALKEFMMSDEDLCPTLKEVEVLAEKAREFSRETKQFIFKKPLSLHEDSILQKLLLSLSLLSMERLNDCSQKQAAARFRGEEKSLYDILLDEKQLDAKTLDHLLHLQNENGENLFYGYEVRDKLGEGGLGVVYRACQLSLNRDVALKIFAPEVGSSSDLIVRFMREAEIATKLDHPNIVKAVDFGNSYGLYYFIMELVLGQSLERLIREKGVMDELEAVSIWLKIASALQHMWLKNIIYRDLKPANIIIHNSHVKICDLGLAKDIGVTDSNQLTTAGKVVGTPAYIAPEVFNEEDIDFRVDVYSLGIVMYLMMTGELPFNAQEKTVLFHQHTSIKPISPKKKNLNISPEINALILKFLAKKPDDRCNTPEDVIDELENLKFILKNKKKNPKVKSEAKTGYGKIIAVIIVLIFIIAGIGIAFSGKKGQDQQNKQNDQTQNIEKKNETENETENNNKTNENAENTEKEEQEELPDNIDEIVIEEVYKPGDERIAQVIPESQRRDYNKLTHYLASKDMIERRSAIYYLGISKDKRASQLLYDALASNTVTVRMEIMTALYYRKDPGSINLLLKALEDKSPLVRNKVTDVLARFPETIPKLEQILAKNPNPIMKAEAVIALAKTKKRTAKKKVLACLHHEIPEVRKAAARGIRIFRGYLYYKKLFPLLKDKDARVKKEAVTTLHFLLSKMGSSSKATEIEKVLKETGNQ